MDMGACALCGLKTSTNFHGLDRWNTHHGHAQPCTEAAIPLTEAAQTDWYAKRDHLKSAAASIPFVFCRQDALNHFLRQGGIGTAHRRSLDRLPHTGRRL